MSALVDLLLMVGYGIALLVVVAILTDLGMRRDHARREREQAEFDGHET